MAKLKRNPGFIPHIDPRQVEGDKIRKQERDRIKAMIADVANGFRREFVFMPDTDIPVDVLIETLDHLHDTI
jgi:hypothetical protein